MVVKWCYDTQHNDIQHNGTQFNDSQYKDTQHNDIQHNDAHHKGLISDTQHKQHTAYKTQHDNTAFC